MAIMVPPRRPRLMNPFDPFETFDSLFSNVVPRPHSTMSQYMRSDVKEREDGFEIAIDLPGFRKESISASLDQGYLTVKASNEPVPAAAAGNAEAPAEKPADCTFLCKERFTGSCSRTFFLGEDILEDAVKAKFDDGVLTISVPKKPKEPVLETSRAIDIF